MSLSASSALLGSLSGDGFLEIKEVRDTEVIRDTLLLVGIKITAADILFVIVIIIVIIVIFRKRLHDGYSRAPLKTD